MDVVVELFLLLFYISTPKFGDLIVDHPSHLLDLNFREYNYIVFFAEYFCLDTLLNIPEGVEVF